MQENAEKTVREAAAQGANIILLQVQCIIINPVWAVASHLTKYRPHTGHAES